MGSFTWKNALPRLGFELADLNHCPLSLCAFMYVNGSTCWLWPHFPLCLESVTGRVDVTLRFFPPRGAWLLGLLASWLELGWNYLCIKLFVFLLALDLDRGSGKVAERAVMNCQTTSLTSRVGLYVVWILWMSDGSKRLRLTLCPCAPWTDTDPPSPRKYLLLLGR